MALVRQLDPQRRPPSQLRWRRTNPPHISRDSWISPFQSAEDTMSSALKYMLPVPPWAYVCVWACCVWAWATAALPQRFPEASEDNHFSFRSDGTYSFSYDTGGGQHQSFRIERRDSAGRVSGRFGYVDPDGALRITEYQADKEGYRSNMETYHLVSWLPRFPLLVGPIPRPPSESEESESPERTAEGREGAPVFFPPDGPVLIVGPLPKPFQPQKDLREPPNLSRESLLGASPGPVLPMAFVGGPAPRQDSQVLREGILDVLEILQESIELLNAAEVRDSQGISNSATQDTEFPMDASPPFNNAVNRASTVSMEPVSMKGRLPEEFSNSPRRRESAHISEAAATNRSEAGTAARMTMSADGLTTEASPGPTTIQRPLTTTTSLGPSRPTPTLTKESRRGLPAAWASSPTSSVTGDDSERYPSATFPPLPALTYLPVARVDHETPADAYSHLPQVFNPFFMTSIRD